MYSVVIIFSLKESLKEFSVIHKQKIHLVIRERSTGWGPRFTNTGSTLDVLYLWHILSDLCQGLPTLGLNSIFRLVAFLHCSLILLATKRTRQREGARMTSSEPGIPFLESLLKQHSKRASKSEMKVNITSNQTYQYQGLDAHKRAHQPRGYAKNAWLQSNHKKTSDKHRLRDMVYDNWPVLFKRVMIMKEWSQRRTEELFQTGWDMTKCHVGSQTRTWDRKGTLLGKPMKFKWGL